jgi:TolB protein
MQIVLLLISFLCVSSCLAQTAVEFSVAAEKFQRMNVKLYLIDHRTPQAVDSQVLAATIKKDLEFTNQFAVDVERAACLPFRNQMVRWSTQNIPFVVFVTVANDQLEWRLYDSQSVAMIAGKKIALEPHARMLAHRVADGVWTELTGTPGFFATKIAYCKEHKYKNKIVRAVHIADYDGSHEQCVTQVPTLHMAPRWNNDPENPLLFFSESTNTNIRLASIDFNGNKKIASNFAGLNMLPSFSSDGKAVVYAASRGGGNCQLYYFKKGYFKRLTHNTGNNVSPVFIDGNTIAFCSDFKNGRPYLYTYNLTNGDLELLVEGYCCSPTYNAQHRLLAYGKMVKGCLQLFTYDMTTKKNTQITFDATNKEECSWSACGNFLLYASENKGASRIALFNRATEKITYITAAHESCSYPNWSRAYTHVPSSWL